MHEHLQLQSQQVEYNFFIFFLVSKILLNFVKAYITYSY